MLKPRLPLVGDMALKLPVGDIGLDIMDGLSARGPAATTLLTTWTIDAVRNNKYACLFIRVNCR